MAVLFPSTPRNKSLKLVSRRLVLIVVQYLVLSLLKKLMLLLPPSPLLFPKLPLPCHPSSPRSPSLMPFSWPLLLSRLISRTWTLKPPLWIPVSLPRPLPLTWLLPMLWLLKSTTPLLLPRPLMVSKCWFQIDFGFSSYTIYALSEQFIL